MKLRSSLLLSALLLSDTHAVTTLLTLWTSFIAILVSFQVRWVMLSMTNVRCTDRIFKLRIFSPTADGRLFAFEVTSFVIAPMPVLETLSEYLLMSLYLFNLFKIYLNVALGTFYLSSSVCVSVYMRQQILTEHKIIYQSGSLFKKLNYHFIQV